MIFDNQEQFFGAEGDRVRNEVPAVRRTGAQPRVAYPMTPNLRIAFGFSPRRNVQMQKSLRAVLGVGLFWSRSNDERVRGILHADDPRHQRRDPRRGSDPGTQRSMGRWRRHAYFAQREGEKYIEGVENRR